MFFLKRYCPQPSCLPPPWWIFKMFWKLIIMWHSLLRTCVVLPPGYEREWSHNGFLTPIQLSMQRRHWSQMCSFWCVTTTLYCVTCHKCRQSNDIMTLTPKMKTLTWSCPQIIMSRLLFLNKISLLIYYASTSKAWESGIKIKFCNRHVEPHFIVPYQNSERSW